MTAPKAPLPRSVLFCALLCLVLGTCTGMASTGEAMALAQDSVSGPTVAPGRLCGRGATRRGRHRLPGGPGPRGPPLPGVAAADPVGALPGLHAGDGHRPAPARSRRPVARRAGPRALRCRHRRGDPAHGGRGHGVRPGPPSSRRPMGEVWQAQMALQLAGKDAETLALAEQIQAQLPAAFSGFSAMLTAFVAGSMLAMGQYLRSQRVQGAFAPVAPPRNRPAVASGDRLSPGAGARPARAAARPSPRAPRLVIQRDRAVRAGRPARAAISRGSPKTWARCPSGQKRWTLAKASSSTIASSGRSTSAYSSRSPPTLRPLP